MFKEEVPSRAYYQDCMIWLWRWLALTTPLASKLAPNSVMAQI